MHTDYFVKGCGAMAMAFVDVMLRETDATFTIVDQRAAPGGHWNDAYPFVRLHQPSASYGVPSRPLGHQRRDTTGFNEGLYELASGFEVADYFHQVMRDTFLPTGRVSYHPVSEVVGEEGGPVGEFVSLLSGERHRVEIRRRFVDATLLQTSIPLTHTRSFEVAAGVTCIPPNDLTRLAPRHAHFTILGGGKTAIDAALWLLANGARPQAMSWVLPRDAWLLNRAHYQPGDDCFEQGIGALATQNEIAATATSVREFCERMEAAGVWLRLDSTVWPTMMHGATVTLRELDALRTIGRCIRGQRLRRIERGRMMLESREVATDPDELFIDCTARALGGNVHVRLPVFSARVIRLQILRQYSPPFSAAVIGHLEASIADEDEKQRLAQPAPMSDTVQDWMSSQLQSMTNQSHWNANKELMAWIANCRLDLFSGTARRIRPDEESKRAVLTRMREYAAPARTNLERLLKTV